MPSRGRTVLPPQEVCASGRSTTVDHLPCSFIKRTYLLRELSASSSITPYRVPLPTHSRITEKFLPPQLCTIVSPPNICFSRPGQLPPLSPNPSLPNLNAFSKKLPDLRHECFLFSRLSNLLFRPLGLIFNTSKMKPVAQKYCEGQMLLFFDSSQVKRIIQLALVHDEF